ncbi:hypothetical protein K438DRAFT_749070 [Mycena galopus ATCC 62051]|nr:hypothetical protein K438DRAFT_749070 [Mycena galopus ATCC 62051]
MSSASTSTASLLSKSTTSSRAPLNGSATVQPKDFQAAFASLQSAYGFSGSAPTPVPKTQNAAAPPSAVPSPATRTPPKGANKNFESAFADLQSTYGFSGAAPCSIPKSKNNK